QTYRHARPLGALGNFSIHMNLDATQELMNDFLVHSELLSFAFRDATRLLTANCPDRAFEISHTRLARVVPDQETDGLIRNLDLLRRDAVLFDLPRHKIFARDVQLLFLAVPLQFDYLHAVAQRLRYRVQLVRRADEQYL